LPRVPAINLATAAQDTWLMSGRLSFRESIDYHSSLADAHRLSALILGSANGLTPSSHKGSDYAKRAAASALPAR